MQIQMQGLVAWLVGYNLVELPLACGGEVTIKQNVSSHI